MYLSPSQVKVHLLIGGGQSFKIVCAHSPKLQLEGARRFKVAVDPVLIVQVP